MKQHPTATRRGFLKASALLTAPALSAPMAAVSALASVPANSADTQATASGPSQADLKARLALLEDEAAIRQTRTAWLQRIHSDACESLPAETVRRLTPDPASLAGRINIAADRQSAEEQLDCLVELETPLAAGSASTLTLVRMARAQGQGTTRDIQQRTLTLNYLKTANGWQIESVLTRHPESTTAPVALPAHPPLPPPLAQAVPPLPANRAESPAS